MVQPAFDIEQNSPADALGKAESVFLDDVSANMRIETAIAVARWLRNAELDPAAKTAARRFIRRAAADRDVEVRRAIAQELARSDLLEDELAAAMALDDVRVGAFILSDRRDLADVVLLQVVARGGTYQQIALAERERLSAEVCAALARQGCEEAAGLALANPRADFTESALHDLVERFRERETMLAAISCRPGLPLSVVDRLYVVSGDFLRRHIAQTQALPCALAVRLIAEGSADAGLQARLHPEPAALAAALAGAGQIGETVLARAAVQGGLEFLSYALAALCADKPGAMAAALGEGSQAELEALFAEAGAGPERARLTALAVLAWRGRKRPGPLDDAAVSEVAALLLGSGDWLGEDAAYLRRAKPFSKAA